jgi:hypothetical protein
VVTKTVTLTRPATVANQTGAPVGPSAAALAAARTLGATAVANDAELAATPVGDAVFLTAAAAAAGTLATATTPATQTTKSSTANSHGSLVAGHASGEYAVAFTNGTFRHPSQIVLNISASPSQPGSVDWNIVCSEVGGGVGREEGRAPALQLPAAKTIALPAPSVSCIGSANVQLSKTGTVSISLSG